MLKFKIFFNKFNKLKKEKKILFLNKLFKENFISNEIISILFSSKNKTILQESNFFYLLNNNNNINKDNLLQLFDNLKLNYLNNFFDNYKTYEENFEFCDLSNSKNFENFNIDYNKDLKFLYVYRYLDTYTIENNFDIFKNHFFKNIKKKKKNFIYNHNLPIFIPYHLLLQKSFEDLDEDIINNTIEMFIILYKQLLLNYNNNKISFNIFYKLFIIFKNLDLNILEELNEKLIDIEKNIIINNKPFYTKIKLLRESFLFFNEEYSYQNDFVEFSIQNPDYLDNLHYNFFDNDIIIEILNELIFKHDFKNNNLSYIINKFFIYIKHFDLLNPLNFKNLDNYKEIINDLRDILEIDDLYERKEIPILHKDFYLGVKTILNYYFLKFDIEYDNNIINSLKYIYNDYDIENLNSNYIYYILYDLYNKNDKIKNILLKQEKQKLSIKEKKEISSIILKNNLIKHYFNSDINYYLPLKITLINELRKINYNYKYEEELFKNYLKNSIISEKEQIEIINYLKDENFIYNLLENKNISILIFDKLLDNQIYLYKNGINILKTIQLSLIEKRN